MKIFLSLMTLAIFISACEQQHKPAQDHLTNTDTPITINTSIHEYIVIDSAILSYISSQKDYIALSNYQALPSEVQICYNNIKLFLYERQMDIDSYFINLEGVSTGNGKLHIPLYHYLGFVLSKQIEDQNIAHQSDKGNGGGKTPITNINGNLSGKDGTLEIDTFTHSVISFSLWQ